MTLAAIMDGAFIARLSCGPDVPEGAVTLSDDMDPAPWLDKCWIDGAWVDLQDIPAPVAGMVSGDYVVTFSGLPDPSTVRVLDHSLAEFVAEFVTTDGAAEITLTEPGAYQIEVIPPAPYREWSGRIEWSL